MHTLKILPKWYEAITSGNKRFEVRKNNRNFQVGDLVCLQEWSDLYGGYTGSECVVKIKYILKDPEWCKEDTCIFGFDLASYDN